MTDADWPADPGLAAERTAMAWMRTGMSLFGVSALVARQSASVPVAAVVVVVALTAAVWLVVDAERRHTRLGASAGPVVAPTPVLVATSLSLVLAAVGLLLVVA